MRSKKNLLRPLVTLRTPLFNNNLPIILFCSSKAGSTTLFKWFYYQIDELDTALAYHPWIHIYHRDVYTKKIENNVIINNLYPSKKKEVYKLVRNPLKRAVSSYLHLIYYQTQFSEWEKINKLFNSTETDNGISFIQFLYYLKAKGVKHGDVDPHFGQQYFEGEEYFIDKYINLENFNTEILKLEEKYGLKKSPLPKLTKSEHHRSQKVSQSTINPNTLLTEQKLLNAGVPTYDNFYNAESKSLVKEIFKQDFIKYGYNADV